MRLIARCRKEIPIALKDFAIDWWSKISSAGQISPELSRHP